MEIKRTQKVGPEHLKALINSHLVITLNLPEDTQLDVQIAQDRFIPAYNGRNPLAYSRHAINTIDKSCIVATAKHKPAEDEEIVIKLTLQDVWQLVAKDQKGPIVKIEPDLETEMEPYTEKETHTYCVSPKHANDFGVRQKTVPVNRERKFLYFRGFEITLPPPGV